MKNTGMLILAAALLVLSTQRAECRSASSADGIRVVAQRAYELLRAGDYDALYELLSSDTQRRIPRARFVSSLVRARGFYALDRLQLSTVRTGERLAVADVTVYGRSFWPPIGAAKVIARPYFVRENNSWRLALAPPTNLSAADRRLARRFPVREPLVYVQRAGSWAKLGSIGALSRSLGLWPTQ